MRQKTILILAILALPTTVAAIIWPTGTDNSAKTLVSESFFPALPAALPQMHRIRITGEGGTVTLDRQAGAADLDPKSHYPLSGWGLVEKGGYPVAPEAILPIINGFAQIKPLETKTDRPALYGRLNLEDATPKSTKSQQIAFFDQQGKQMAALLVGKRRFDRLGTGEDGVYVRLPSKPQTYFATPAFEAPSDPLSWISRSILDLDSETIKTVTIVTGTDQPLTLDRANAEDQLTPKDLPKGAALRSANAGSEAASAFRSLDLIDVQPATALKATPRSKIHVTCFDGVVVDLAVTAQDDHLWLTITVPRVVPGGTSGTASGMASGMDEAGRNRAEAIKTRTAGWAYEIPEGRAKNLEITRADLLAEPDGALGDGTKAPEQKPRPRRPRPVLPDAPPAPQSGQP